MLCPCPICFRLPHARAPFIAHIPPPSEDVFALLKSFYARPPFGNSNPFEWGWNGGGGGGKSVTRTAAAAASAGDILYTAHGRDRLSAAEKTSELKRLTYVRVQRSGSLSPGAQLLATI